jgi:positive regulator of sigma E activity
VRSDCLSVTGRVVEIDESVEPAEILVEPQRACADCRGCFWRAATLVRVPSCSNTAWVPGVRVRLTLPASYVLVASAWLYGVPLVALVGGALLGSVFDPAGDVGAILGACGGLALAGAALVHARARLERRIRAGLDVAEAS